ncbi:hypothetical protein D3C86_2051460 [compost metagenome]
MSSSACQVTLAVGMNALSVRRIGCDQVQLVGTTRSSVAVTSWKFQLVMSATVPFLYGEASSEASVN